MAVATEIVATEPQRVSRAPSDVLRLAVAAVLLIIVLIVGRFFGDTVAGFVTDLFRGLDSLPTWLFTAIATIGELLGLVLLVAGLIATIVRRQWLLLGSVLIAAVGAGLLFSALHPLVSETNARIVQLNDKYTLLDADQTPSGTALAIVAAIVTVVSPWLPRRWREAAWTYVVLETIVHFLGAVESFDTAIAVLAGWTVGSAVVVAIGAPSRRPSGETIAAGVAAVGVPLARLEQASVDARGSTPYFATAADGSKLFVKALGADERSADLLFRIYRRIQPRDLGDEKAFSSLRRAVEHEALVALAARDAGIRTPRLVAFATAKPNGYALAYEAIAGRSLDRLEPDEMTDDVLDGVWAQLAMLRERRIAHRDLRLANVFLDDDGVAWIIDFGFSELAASDLLLTTDLAELLASSATVVGVDRALAAAGKAIDAPAITGALDRLKLPMLSGATRTAMKAEPGLLDSLRGQIEGTAALR